MRFLKLSLIVMLIIGLAACASWRKYAYRNGQTTATRTAPPIKVPKKLNTRQMQSYYPIPAVVHQNHSGSTNEKATRKDDIR